jgi:uncharacterized iron-regulated membrane protein
MSLKTLFRWHLWLGLISGVFMFLICLTGSLAVFAEEIDWLVIPPLRVKAPAAGTQLDVDTVLARVRVAYPEARVNGFTFSRGPAFAHVAALQVRKEGRNQRVDAYVNPYTGDVQGDRVVSGGYFSSVYQFLRQSHVRLLMGLWGRVFVGVCGVSLVLSCITGLWIYRGWIKKMFTLRLSGGWGNRPPWAEMHKFIGVWSLLFNVLIGLTGAVLGIENLVNQVESKWLRKRPAPAVAASASTDEVAVGTTAATRARANEPQLPVSALLAKAREAFPDFTPRTLTFPARAGAAVGIRGEVPSMLVAQSHVRTSNSITLDPTTGAVVRITDGRKYTGWSRVYGMIDPLHFGYFGGLPTKIIWFILGLTPCVLAVSGTLMWWRRRARATAPRGTDVPPVPAHGQDARATIRWITIAAIAFTLVLAYAIVARAFNNWAFTHRFAEFWIVKPISIALCAFPVTILLAWLAARTRTRPWIYSGACALMGGWYLFLTRILMP